MGHKLANDTVSTDYQLGDRFTVVRDTSTFNKGSVVEFFEDDGSTSPCFKLIEGSMTLDFTCANGEPGAYLPWHTVEPLSEKIVLKEGDYVLLDFGKAITEGEMDHIAEAFMDAGFGRGEYGAYSWNIWKKVGILGGKIYYSDLYFSENQDTRKLTVAQVLGGVTDDDTPDPKADEKRLNIGDKVVICEDSDYYNLSPVNPDKSVKGVVIHHGPLSGFDYRVQWAEGQNVYREDDLQLVEETVEQAQAEVPDDITKVSVRIHKVDEETYQKVSQIFTDHGWKKHCNQDSEVLLQRGGLNHWKHLRVHTGTQCASIDNNGGDYLEDQPEISVEEFLARFGKNDEESTLQLQPGDYILCDDVADDDYHEVAKRFLAAGAESGEYPAHGYFEVCDCFGWAASRGLWHFDEGDGHGTRLLTVDEILETQEAPEESIEDTPEDNWIPHEGGICPINKGVLVDVRFRNGEEYFGLEALGIMGGGEAGSAFWRHDGMTNDIVAYRLHESEETQQPALDDGEWITWGGGKMPVERGTQVDVMYRNGMENLHVSAGVFPAWDGSDPDHNAQIWEHSGVDFDIVAYRLHKPVQEQREQVVEAPIEKMKSVEDFAVRIEGISEDLYQRVCDVFIAHGIPKHDDQDNCILDRDGSPSYWLYLVVNYEKQAGVRGESYTEGRTIISAEEFLDYFGAVYIQEDFDEDVPNPTPRWEDAPEWANVLLVQYCKDYAWAESYGDGARVIRIDDPVVSFEFNLVASCWEVVSERPEPTQEDFDEAFDIPVGGDLSGDATDALMDLIWKAEQSRDEHNKDLVAWVSAITLLNEDDLRTVLLQALTFHGEDTVAILNKLKERSEAA